MEKCRVLKSVAAGTVFYVLISFFFGPSGLLAEKQMFEQKKDLVNYTNRIEKINNELKMEKLALQGDDEVIASYARKLGYVNNDEKLVKIKGLPVIETQIFDPGIPVVHKSIKTLSEDFCKAFALVFGVLIYIIMILYGLFTGQLSLPKKKKYMHVVKGTSVYDFN